MTLIEDCFQQAINEAAQGNRDAFVTLEARHDQAKWMQFTYDLINAAYPLQQDPIVTLTQLSITLPQYVEVSSWEPGTFVTFEHGAEPLPELVRFAEEYLIKVLGVSTSETTLQIVEPE